MTRPDLDKETIERAFHIMGQHLLDRKRFAEICLFGGSALLFLFEWRRTSQDVDVVIRSEHGAVLAARNEAARRLRLPESWLNEGVTQYVATLAGGAFQEVGLYPSYERPALRVLVAEPAYLLAMKVMAMGDRATVDDRDFRDAVRLAASLGLTSVDAVLAVLRTYFPAQALPALAEMRLGELVGETARLAKGSA